MAFISSQKSRLLVGKVNVSCITRGFDAANQRATHDRTSLCDDSYVFIPGNKSGTVSVSAMFDNAAASGSYWAEIVANHAGDAAVPVTVAQAGSTATSPVWMVDAHQVNFGISSEVDGAVDTTFEFETTGDTKYGVILDDDTAAVTATGNSAVFDGAAGSSNGGIAHLHVTVVSGTTPTNDVIIEHSTNGSTGWTTLATFAQVTGSTATERVVVAGTVNRYLRVGHTVGGTDPSYTLTVAFARS